MRRNSSQGVNESPVRRRMLSHGRMSLRFLVEGGRSAGVVISGIVYCLGDGGVRLWQRISGFIRGACAVGIVLEILCIRIG